MPFFVKKPIVVEAVQWTGDNLEELRKFTGIRSIEEGRESNKFNPIGTFLLEYLNSGSTAELWVDANQAWLPLEPDEWVVKDKLGCYPVKSDTFDETYEPVPDRP